MPRICFAIVLLMASFVFAGSSKLPDACTLLTAQDVQSVVGAGFELSPFHGMSSDSSNCGYTKDPKNVANLTLIPASGGAAATLSGMMKMQSERGFKVTPVQGLGEGAYYGEKNIPGAKQFPNVATLHFGKGEIQALLDVQLNGKPDIEAAQKLAKLVYDRMK